MLLTTCDLLGREEAGELGGHALAVDVLLAPHHVHTCGVHLDEVGEGVGGDAYNGDVGILRAVSDLGDHITALHEVFGVAQVLVDEPEVAVVASLLLKEFHSAFT